MKIQEELETLYGQALEYRKQGRAIDAEDAEARAAQVIGALKSRIEKAPTDPETAALLLYLAEREWLILGDHEEVRTKIERALTMRERQIGAQHPLTAEALTKLAEFHFLSGRYQEAVPLFQRAITIFGRAGSESPLHQVALEGISQALASLGRAAEADPYFAQAIEHSPNDERSKRALYYLLIYRAEGLETLNRHAEAESLRKRASSLLPKTNPGAEGFHV